MELRPHPEDCCDTVASLETWLRAVIFRVLLYEACVFSKNFQNFYFYLRSTDEVIDETSFEVRSFCSSVLKVEISLSFSFPLLRFHFLC